MSLDVVRLLAAAAPLTARRVLYLGDGGADFTAAYLARNPKAAVVTDPSAPAGFHAVVLGPGANASQAARLLVEGGVALAADGGAGPAGLHPLTPWQGEGEGAVARWRKGLGRPALHLRMATYAPTLMDIRTRLPARELASDPELVVTHVRPPFGLESLPVDTPRILVLQRPALVEADGWRDLMSQIIVRGWMAVMEYDDHPELVAEVKQRVLSPPDWERFGYLHAVQTSTPRLKAVFDAYNPEVVVFPNSVFDLPPFPERPPRRVFYGAVSRGAFAAEVARALAPATAQFPEVEYVVIGDRAVFDALPTARKVFHEFTTYDGYLALMATCSVSLSPIEGRPYQDTKSDAKFLDAARSGALFIGSPTIYAEVVEHGVNGLIAPAVADWAPLLSRALGDEDGRRAMAKRAWDYVRNGRMFADQDPIRRGWYQSLWDRRAELEAGLMARLPGLAQAVAARRG